MLNFKEVSVGMTLALDGSHKTNKRKEVFMGYIDKASKRIFTHPEMVRDLLKGFVKQKWVDSVDFDTLTPIPTDHVDERLGHERFNDVVWKVDVKGKELFICIMLEFQSEPEKYMPLRIMTYLGLLYQDLKSSKIIRGEEKLPPVFPIVLYNGKKAWN